MNLNWSAALPNFGRDFSYGLVCMLGSMLGVRSCSGAGTESGLENGLGLLSRDPEWGSIRALGWAPVQVCFY